MLANIRIGKKLALAFGGSFCAIACLMATALWATHEINVAMKEARRFGHMTTLAEKVSANEGAIAQRVATMVLEREAGKQILDQLLALRKDYLAAFEELKSMTSTDEGSRLLGEAEAAAAKWRAADNRVIALLQAHQPGEAASLHHQQVVPYFNQLGKTIADYLAYSEQRLKRIDADAREVTSWFSLLLVAAGCLSLAGLLIIGVVLSRSISRPLGFAVTHLSNLAAGHVSRDVPNEYLERGDEVGLLSKAMQTLSVTLRQLLSELGSNIQLLSSTSAGLSANASQMSHESRDASATSHSAAASAEQMRNNVGSVAARMEQTAANLVSVASHTGQMTATIGEIAANSERARRITEDATHQSARINEQMNQLGDAAREIGKVTETITEISSQTNLLALNATIEAARAGSAGKGFAVVANEIKELAQQTAKATEDIKARIESVQSFTRLGITEIETVSKVIHDISEIVSTIAAAIEEQATVTRDIARNIDDASRGVKDANGRVLEASEAMRHISGEIVVVDHAAGKIAQGSEQVRLSVTDLSRVAEQLQAIMSRFYTAKVNQETLLNAIATHSGWTTKLRAMIESGKINTTAGTIKLEEQCEFGRWLDGSQFSGAENQTEQYRQVRKLHARFHEEAARIVQLAVSRQKREAESAMSPSSEYAHISSALTEALRTWSAAEPAPDLR